MSQADVQIGFTLTEAGWEAARAAERAIAAGEITTTTTGDTPA